MKIPRIYSPVTPLAEGQHLTLDKDAAKYLARVLRRKTGDAVTLFNGDGNNYPGIIIEADSDTVVRIDQCLANPNESPLSITLIQSLAKGSKLDLVIQKATELGVSRIVPVSADRSVMQIDEKRLHKRLLHWRGIAISASTQCERSVVPAIEAPQQTSHWLANNTTPTLMLHPEGKYSLGNVSLNSNSCQLLIGPEGGFSEHEVRLATSSANVELVRCGPRILRTETAGFTAMSILQARFGDL